MKTLLIGIDGNEANITRRVGSNVYAFELITHIYQHVQKTKQFKVRVYLSQPPVADMPQATEQWQYHVFGPAKFWTLWRLPIELYRQNDLDLFFSPGHYLPLFSPVPTVNSIMDLAYEHFPQQFTNKDLQQLKWLTSRAVLQAEHVFAISNATKNDVLDRYHLSPEKVSITYPAVKEVRPLSSAKVAEVLQKFSLSAPYILFVGTLQPRKNIERLVEAFERLSQMDPELELVLAGKYGWLSEGIAHKIESSPQKSKIRVLGYVSEEEKTGLIQGAKVTTLLGLYEGFGFPPLESIQLGTLPVVANTASLPEVVGKDGIMVDPYSVDDIVQGFQRVLELSEREKKTLLEKLQQHAQQFSWQKTAQHVCDTLERLAKNEPVAL